MGKPKSIISVLAVVLTQFMTTSFVQAQSDPVVTAAATLAGQQNAIVQSAGDSNTSHCNNAIPSTNVEDPLKKAQGQAQAEAQAALVAAQAAAAKVGNSSMLRSLLSYLSDSSETPQQIQAVQEIYPQINADLLEDSERKSIITAAFAHLQTSKNPVFKDLMAKVLLLGLPYALRSSLLANITKSSTPEETELNLEMLYIGLYGATSRRSYSDVPAIGDLGKSGPKKQAYDGDEELLEQLSGLLKSTSLQPAAYMNLLSLESEADAQSRENVAKGMDPQTGKSPHPDAYLDKIAYTKLLEELPVSNDQTILEALWQRFIAPGDVIPKVPYDLLSRSDNPWVQKQFLNRLKTCTDRSCALVAGDYFRKLYLKNPASIHVDLRDLASAIRSRIASSDLNSCISYMDYLKDIAPKDPIFSEPNPKCYNSFSKSLIPALDSKDPKVQDAYIMALRTGSDDLNFQLKGAALLLQKAATTDDLQLKGKIISQLASTPENSNPSDFNEEEILRNVWFSHIIQPSWPQMSGDQANALRSFKALLTKPGINNGQCVAILYDVKAINFNNNVNWTDLNDKCAELPAAS